MKELAGVKTTKEYLEFQRVRDAAPALLQALENVLNAGRGVSGRIILEAEDEEEIRLAIKQARGE